MRRRGLTLVELLMVIVVAGVLITLAVPSFSDMISRQRVRGVNAELVSDLQFARSQAVQQGPSTGAGIQIYFRKTAGVLTCYSIFSGTAVGGCDCLEASPTTRCILPAKEIKTYRLPNAEGVSITSSHRKVKLYDARASVSNDLVVTVEANSPRSGKLQTTLSQVGQITVCSPDGSISGVPSC